jgi:nitric oxide reductase NorE protein
VSAVLTQTQPKLLPGDFAIWIFIFMELLVFGILFVCYAVVRVENLDLFNHYQQTLHKELGLANTLVLIASSYFVVRAVQAIKLDKVKQCIYWLLSAIVGGFVFLIVKSFEYADMFAAGIKLTTNTFYMFYLSLTMFHFLHVILGMVILIALVFKAKNGRYNKTNYTGIETGASYWHMVDLVWIILFPLVYLMR